MSIAFAMCRDPFEPKIDYSETNFLVVEGYINVGGGVTTIIKLARTVKLNEESIIHVEEGAVIRIEDDNGNEFPLSEVDPGIYRSSILDLSLDRLYRLHITVTSGREYVSRFEEPKITPQIDSVTWERTTLGLDILVATHDDSNQTKYYQWEFEEAWEIKSSFRSFFMFENGEVDPRPVAETELMSRCWKYAETNRLIYASTAALNSDVVQDKKILSITQGDDRIVYKYSVSVRQHALSQDHYDYLQLMEKNTGSVGSFSDPQPSQLYGNLQCLNDPEEPVVGFVGSYTTEEKRIFIYPHQLPGWAYEVSCREVEVTLHPDSIQKYFVKLQLVPTTGASFAFPSLEPLSYNASAEQCIDCRKTGGVNRKPDFWD